jgi:hypothetical protein
MSEIMNSNKIYQTDFLFPKPNKLQGIATIFNLWGLYFLYNGSKDGDEADRRAIQSDWGMIGQDLKDVLDKVEAELQIG